MRDWGPFKGTDVADWLRAGGLTTGVGVLLASAMIGLDRLGFVEWPKDFDTTFVLIIAISLACGVTLGQRRAARGGVGFAIRAVLAFVVGSAIGALLVGLSFLLVRFLDIPERKLPPFFLVAAGLLIGGGVRHLPRRWAARAALGGTLALVVALRVLASVPSLAHVLERRLFPLTVASVRSIWDQRSCGALCVQHRVRVLSVAEDITYPATGGPFLQAEARVRATVEATRAFFVDGCGQAHDARPPMQPGLGEFETTAACVDVRPKLRVEWNTHIPDPACCAVESYERRPGDRFEVTRVLDFTFFRGEWKPDHEDR